jgi:hypothetical protein
MTLPPATLPMAPWLEDAWLSRYLQRSLSEHELEWFEAYMLDKPQLLDRVDADSDLRDALATESGVRATGGSVVDPPVESATVVPMRDAAQRRATVAQSRRSSPLAWAASILVAFGVGGFAARGLQPGSTIDGVIASPTRVVFETLRGAEAPANVYPGDPTSALVLIEIDVPADATGITFIDPSGRKTGLRPGADGFAGVLVPRSVLVKGPPSTLEYQWQGRSVRRELAIEL